MEDPGRTPDGRLWVRMRHRGHKVWARIGGDGRPLAEGGRVRFRYALDQPHEYSARPEDLLPLDAAPTGGGAGVTIEVPDGVIAAWVDGACSRNPGPAGAGVVLLFRGRRREISRFLGPDLTNNIAELTAARIALQEIRRPEFPVRIHTDSAYLIGVLTARWKATKNTELIEAIRADMVRFSDVTFVKVPGHAGFVENERADALARQAILAERQPPAPLRKRTARRRPAVPRLSRSRRRTAGGGPTLFDGPSGA